MSYATFPELPITGTFEFFITTWGNTTGGFMGITPVIIGGTFPTSCREVPQDARMVGLIFEQATSTVPSDRTLTVQINGSDTALALSLLTGESTKTIFTPAVDISQLDQIAIRHSAAVASNATCDGKMVVLYQRRAM